MTADSQPVSMNRGVSIRRANLFYLAVYLLLLVGSLLLPGIPLGRRVVINELALLALPLGLFLLLAVPRRRVAHDVLRLRGVSWPVAALSLVIGIGLWRFDWWLTASVNEALGYTIPLPPEALNVTTLDKAAMAVGAAILAPIVEELIFRGVLQSAYERRGPLRAVTMSTLLFVAIHQELAQSIAIVPVTLALGYVAWRTQSIIPAILVHFGNNGQGIVVSWLAEGRPRRVAFAPSTAGALVGLVMGVGALLLLTRLTSRPREPRKPVERGWLGRNWPLLPVLPIYAAIIGLTLLVGLRPDVLALGRRVEPVSAPWEGETRWTYEIANALEEPVGKAECSLTPEQTTFVLECAMEQEAYEVDARSGFFREGAATQRQAVRWEAETLELVETEIDGAFGESADQVRLSATVEGGGLSVRVAGGPDGESRFDRCYSLVETGKGPPASVDPCRVDGAFVAGGGFFSPLMVGEWPWRLSALPFELLYSAEGTLLWPYRSVEGLDGRAPVTDEVFVVVRTAEQVSTPAGEFVTWRVTVGEAYTGWYTVDPPHHLVAYSDDMVTWRLTAVE